MRDAFSTYHPVVNFSFFALVLGFTMFFTHPVCLAVSLTCAFTYSLYLKGVGGLRFSLLYMLPLLTVTALLNPLFNHQGATIITYFKSGNPLTLESILYGIAAAVLLISVIHWFSCFNEVITSDKLVYLFGRALPSLSLILSMTLRFVPRFTAQYKVVDNAQRGLGRAAIRAGLINGARRGIRILSIMATWALENAVDAADSMKSRGYGLKGRTAFSIYTFDRRDALALLYLALSGAYVIIGAALNGLDFRWFPTLKAMEANAFSISIYTVYFALNAMPIAINLWEDAKWNSIQSGI